MDIKLQKRHYSSLRKLTKVDENNNIIEEQSNLYVRVEDVPSNLINNDATPLSEEIFKKINWKDNNALLFKQTDTLPEPISGLTQIVSLNNGQIWCIPGNNIAAFKLGADDLATYLKKNFQSYDNVTVLGANTIIGALPADFIANGNVSKSTYLDVVDGSIAFKINGAQKHLLNNEKVSFTQGNGEICINDTEIALKHHSDKTTIGLTNGSFYIKGNNTQISEDLTSGKLNFYTNLGKAIYGNKTIYLEFYSDQVRFLDAVNQKEMFNVKQNGSVYAYGPIYASGTNRVIDTSNIDSYIKTYLDENFERKFLECYDKVVHQNIYFEGADRQIYYDVSGEEALFKIDFSKEINSDIMTIYFNGSKIENLSKEFKAESGMYYLVRQVFAIDDSETDYIEVIEYNSQGVCNGTVWIRGLYRL